MSTSNSMKHSMTFLFMVCFVSCIPLRRAPHIETSKVLKVKRFNIDIPKRYGFVFVDSKAANEFYHFINLKYKLRHRNVSSNVPIQIDG